MDDIKKQNKMITLKAYSHPYFEKGFRWYFVVGLICAIILGGFIYLKLYLGALALVVTTVVWLIYTKKPQEETTCTISEEGVRFGEKFYPKHQLKSFSIITLSRQNMLYLEISGFVRPAVHISLGDQPVEAIRKILTDYLPERMRQEDFADKLIRWLKI